MTKELLTPEQIKEARLMSGLPTPFVVSNHIIRINYNSTDQFKASDFICTNDKLEPVSLDRSFEGVIILSTRQLIYRNNGVKIYSYEYQHELAPIKVIQYAEDGERYEHEFENVDHARKEFPQLRVCHNLYVYIEIFKLVKRLQVKGANCRSWWDYERTFNDGSLLWDRKTVFSNSTEKLEKENETVKYFKINFAEGERNESTLKYFNMMKEIRENVFDGKFGKENAELE